MAAGKAGLARGGLDDVRHPVVAAAASTVSVSSRTNRRFAIAVLRRISTVLASQIVQVAREAKASPVITTCTTMSALANMFHGDRLRGSNAASLAASTAPGSCATAAAATFKLRRIVKSSTCRCMVVSGLTMRIGYAAPPAAVLSASVRKRCN